MKNSLHILTTLLLVITNCSASDNPVNYPSVEGQWAIEFESNDIGTVNTVFQFKAEENSFTAHTREGAAKDILGFWKATLAKRVVDTTFTGGIFLTHKWFENHDILPDESDYDQFPQFTEANYDLIIEGIHKEKGLLLKVIPKEQHYTGNLFILTNRNTASTCEPIVYGLKQINRATIVGTRTAGAMLNGEKFQLKSGFSLFVPTADYYTSDGYRIDQNGVKPDFKVDGDPVEFVMEELIQ